ncbi:MAG: hypothetical protein MZV65_42285 [Chromatiales bacterium]|nr:hypothetical protein [Chromatiales bacterium]
MVLDQEIEKMGGFFLEPGIHIFPVESLQDRIEGAVKANVFLLPEDGRSSELIPKLLDESPGFLIRNGPDFSSLTGAAGTL